MTRILRELERDLLRATGERLVRLGFSARPAGQTFQFAVDTGRAAVHLSFIEHERDFDVTIDIAIRLDAVEDLVHRSNKLLSKKEKAETFTLGVELGNLERGEPFRMKVARKEDVPRVADGIATKLETVGLPYIKQYSRPEAAYGLLSRDDRSVWIHSPIHSERAMRACALLIVMGKQSEVRRLGEQKLSFLESVDDPSATAFSRFLAELPSG